MFSKWFKITAKSGKDERVFDIFTSKNHVQRVAEKTAKNIFYCENVIIINIS